MAIESWYTKLFSMTFVKIEMHLESLNWWNKIVKPKKLKVIVWRTKFQSHITFFSKPNKTYDYQYCKWWLYIILNQPQQSAVQYKIILTTHFGDGTDLRRSPQESGVININDPLSPIVLNSQNERKKSSQCSQCNYLSLCPNELKTHPKMHIREKTKECNQCNFASTWASALRDHQNLHRGEKSNKCNQCDFASSWAGSLRSHLKTHSGEKSNKCNQCDYTWSSASNLRKHF